MTKWLKSGTTFSALKSRKVLSALVVLLLSSAHAFAQTDFVPGPAANGTSGSSRGPNGSVDFQRTAAIYRSTEFPGIPPSAPITAVGFSINTPAATAASGTIKIYMVNTADATYLRGTTWTNIISTPTAMTLVYNGPMTIPAAAGFYNVTLQTPFAYTGGNFYLAYEWNATTKSTASAIYDANADLAASLATITGTTLAGIPSLTGSSAFRPVLNIGFTPPATDAQVKEVFTMGKLAVASGTPHVVQAQIRNGGSTALTNYTVTMNVTGANTFTSTKTVTLASFAQTTVSFDPYTPTATGANTVTVSVANDGFNANNTVTKTQHVTANTLSNAIYPASLTAPVVIQTAIRPVGTPASLTEGLLLSKFKVNNRVRLTTARIYVPEFGTAPNNTNNVGQTIYATIRNSAGVEVAKSANLVLTAGDVNAFVAFTFPTSPIFNNEEFYVGLGVPTNTSAAAFFPLAVQALAVPTTGFSFTGTLTSNTITPQANGTYIYLIEADVTNISGVKGDINANLISVYPNPSNGEFKVSAKDMKGANLNLEVRDLQGKVVYSTVASKDGASVNLKNVASGVYMLRVSTDTEVAVKRIVVE